MSDATDLFSTAPVLTISVASITIPPERQRKNAKADEALVNSIRDQGLINPIILRADGVLVAGERRLDAYRQLEREFIPYRLFESLSPLAAHLIELQENLARKQLTWQEEVEAIAAYHALRVADFAGWTQQATAQEVGISQTYVSRLIIIAKHMDDPDVLACQTVIGAFNLIDGRASRTLAAAEARGLITAVAAADISTASPAEKARMLFEGIGGDITAAATSTSSILDKFEQAEMAKIALTAATNVERQLSSDDRILHASFLDWAPTYAGEKFDVIHCDFPYGKGYAGSNTRRTGRATTAPLYADGADIYFELVDCFLAEQDRFTLPSAHCLFWFDMMHYCWTVEQFTNAGWKLVQPFPLIWTKDYQGVAADPQRRPRHCYETALLFSRGDRKLRRLDKDFFEERVGDDKLHTSQKPLLMLKHFLSLLVDEHTSVLDPTCGSASALVAASQLGAPRILGIELEESNVDIARFILNKKDPPA